MPIVRSHGEYAARCARCNYLSDKFPTVKGLYTDSFVRKGHEWGNLPIVGMLCPDCVYSVVSIIEHADRTR